MYVSQLCRWCRGAASNNLPELKPRDHESANMIIDRSTKDGLSLSHPSCVKLQPNTAMCKDDGQVTVWWSRKTPPTPCSALFLHIVAIIAIFPIDRAVGVCVCMCVTDFRAT